MRIMGRVSWVCFLTVLLSLEFSAVHSHREETEIYHVSVGHFLLLRCPRANAHSKVIWSRGERGNQTLPSGLEVRDGLLWFLPVHMFHYGTYTCEKRDESGFLMVKFAVLVSSGECPDTLENITIPEGVSGSLPCKQNEIFKLNTTRTVRWMKDCQPIDPVSVDETGLLRLHSVSESDAGKYTCLVDVSLNGRNYTAAQSIQLSVEYDPVLTEPQVLQPQQAVFIVTVAGMRKDLECYAYTGFSEDGETSIYWTMNGSFIEGYDDLRSQTSDPVYDKGKVFFHSTLSIYKVRHEFLNVPILCWVRNLVGEKNGVAWLQEADHSAFYIHVALCLSVSLGILAQAAAFFYFKTDVILAYRKLLRHFSKQRVPDGKFYDAYVSFFHPDSQSTDDLASFALQTLPEKLEQKHGYSLYIRGRDDCPGEAMHDVIATTVRQCRRLIIILSSNVTVEEESPLHNNLQQLCYEQKVGIHDALIHNDPRVILVEIGGPVDYTQLPESLQYIKRKQGALKWKNPGNHKFTKLDSNRNFWKNLRYHMPSVPARKLQTII